MTILIKNKFIYNQLKDLYLCKNYPVWNIYSPITYYSYEEYLNMPNKEIINLILEKLQSYKIINDLLTNKWTILGFIISTIIGLISIFKQ